LGRPRPARIFCPAQATHGGFRSGGRSGQQGLPRASHGRRPGAGEKNVATDNLTELRWGTIEIWGMCLRPRVPGPGFKVDRFPTVDGGQGRAGAQGRRPGGGAACPRGPAVTSILRNCTRGTLPRQFDQQAGRQRRGRTKGRRSMHHNRNVGLIAPPHLPESTRSPGRPGPQSRHRGPKETRHWDGHHHRRPHVLRRAAAARGGRTRARNGLVCKRSPGQQSRTAFSSASGAILVASGVRSAKKPPRKMWGKRHSPVHPGRPTVSPRPGAVCRARVKTLSSS